MAGNTKLLLVALCGAVLAASVICVSGASTPTAYRGGAVNIPVPGAMQQQQASTAAGQASVPQVQPMKVLPAAYRDKPSLKDYYYGKKADDYAAPGAAYGNPGYNSQLPNPSYQAPYAAQQAAQQGMPQQPMAGAAYYQPQPQYSSGGYQGYQQQPPQYQQQPQQPQYPPQYPQQPQYQYPQQPPAYQHPEQGGGYYPAPTPKPYYPPAPAPYYPPQPTPKPYYPKPEPKPVSSICQSEVFGAFYTQAVDDFITPDHEIAGVVSAYMGCKDRLTLGGMCSYTCYDGNYLERFVGTTTRITTMPPEDWDNVEPWDHPVYCAWDLGHMALKTMPPPPQIMQEGFNFSCDFTIKAICCDDIVPHVPYGGDVDLGDGGGDGCTDESCDPPVIDCEATPEDVCCLCDPETDCPDECFAKNGKNGTRASAPKKGSKSTKKSPTNNKRGKKSKRANLASDVGSGFEVGFKSIGNAKVTGGVRTPKQDLATSMQAKSASRAQPAVLVPAVSDAAAKASAPTVQASAQKASVKVAASSNAVPASKANIQSR